MNSLEDDAVLDVELQIRRMTDVFGFVEESWCEFSLGFEFFTVLFAELDADVREDFTSNLKMIWTWREVVVLVVKFRRVKKVAFNKVAGISFRIDRHDVKGRDFIFVEEAKVTQW